MAIEPITVKLVRTTTTADALLPLPPHQPLTDYRITQAVTCDNVYEMFQFAVYVQYHRLGANIAAIQEATTCNVLTMTPLMASAMPELLDADRQNKPSHDHNQTTLCMLCVTSPQYLQKQF